jgi:phospholipase/carboxylesterase
VSRAGRISIRPARISQSAPLGLQALELGSMRDSYLYVPQGYRFTEPSALMLVLHGSGGHAHHGVELLQSLADEKGIILVAPASLHYTWGEGPSGNTSDMRRLTKALDHVFNRYAVDPARIAIGGFSDGATYAIEVGLANGELFRYVIAFSPHAVASLEVRDPRHSPRIFISHGMRDEVMPISTCSQRIVRPLELAGIDVEYAEFEAGRRIPPDIASQAIEWFTKASGSSREQRRAQSREIQPTQEG